ncbi:MAG: thermonuclease family protein [Rhodospirillales bacterium]|nr:thermonuclease family protein [Rhodospirillales bacterium]MDH3792826.1 thermonuclease family protein [Rhodospirillales bacterium]MDH3919363.1 thermonuclease family protein [Rhodospirillales bacterium]MDH3967927.1 thermonuclease family protein [Rhodospirillales bacterium]
MTSWHPTQRSWAAGLLALVWLLAGPEFPLRAAEPLAGPVPAVVTAVVDGDTLEVRARIWLGQELTTRVRLAGIDAPEAKSDCPRERALAARARAFLSARLRPAGARAPAAVRLHDIRNGKYAGRVLARVESAAGLDLGRALLAAGLARAYDGGRRAPWCVHSGQ